jgi:hypothetical protein
LNLRVEILEGKPETTPEKALKVIQKYKIYSKM